MGNTLLPLREGVYNAIWLGIVKNMFPATHVKASETIDVTPP